jgi:hypothetical protein
VAWLAHEQVLIKMAPVCFLATSWGRGASRFCSCHSVVAEKSLSIKSENGAIELDYSEWSGLFCYKGILKGAFGMK